MKIFMYFLPIVYCFLAKQNRMNTRRLYGLKYIDHDIENKTIFDKFEYYSVLGDRQKQMETMIEIQRFLEKRRNK